MGALLVTALPTMTYAQDLEDRVEALEQRLKNDQLPADPYISEFGGRLMADWTFNVNSSDNFTSQLGAEPEDGFEFRRARLYVEGAVARNIDYKLQLDFSGPSTSFNDAYIHVHDLGVLPPLKIGQFKEPFSLEELTSSKYITLMSRSMLTDAFSQSYTPGIQTDFHTTDKMLNFTVGAFNPQNGQQAATNGSWDLSGRLTSPLMYQNQGRQVIHLGISGSLRGQGSDTVYESDLEPEVHKGDPEFLEVAVPNVDHSAVYGLEAATVLGSLSIQGEYAQNKLSRSMGAEPTLTSQYLMASYVLTGEHRPYDPEAGDFGRIKPDNPYHGSTSPKTEGFGAWEIAARWSTTDFTEAKGSGITSPAYLSAAGSQSDADNLASEATVITFGANWYPTTHTKWMLNLVDAEQKALDVDSQWVTTRFQVDF
jgi:phosphate-selective porin OprO/OprP